MSQTDQRTAATGTGLVASVGRVGKVTVVTLRGEADVFTLPALVDALARVVADHEGSVVIDLAHADLIDSGTARALVWTAQFLNDRGRTMTLRSPSPLAHQVLAMLGISHLIEPDPSAGRPVDS